MKTSVLVILLLSLLMQAAPRMPAAASEPGCTMGCCAALPVEEHCGCIDAPVEQAPAIPAVPAPGNGREGLPQPACLPETSLNAASQRRARAEAKAPAIPDARFFRPHQAPLTVLFCAFLT